MTHLASVIGSVISIFPAVPIEKLQYSNSEAIFNGYRGIKMVSENYPCAITSLNKPEATLLLTQMQVNLDGVSKYRKPH